MGEFVQVLLEALAIVLLVSFFSLGWRTGLVVAFSIPLVLAMTFASDEIFRPSACTRFPRVRLVLALGLMVDDAIIAVENDGDLKWRQGFSRIKAAGFAWTSTRLPPCSPAP